MEEKGINKREKSGKIEIRKKSKGKINLSHIQEFKHQDNIIKNKIYREKGIRRKEGGKIKKERRRKGRA